MTEPPVSIVVPVHNAVEFLPRCFAAIESQTFQDFEVVLVDDGSTDGSSVLCDEFAKRRERASVIRHASPSGVSAARNAGVAASSGRFIGFVDSDDWIAPTMVETLYRVITETESDVAQVGYVICSKERPIENAAETICVLSADEALAEMLLREEYAVWNRLYRRSLFDACMPGCFPEGLTCEDRVGNFKLLSRARSVAVSSRIEYFYFLNLGSISHNGLDKRGFDLLAADRIMVDLARAYGNERVLALAEDRAAKSSFSLLVKWARFGVTDSELDADEALGALFDDYRENYGRLMKSSMSAAKKAVAWQLRHCVPLLKFEFGLVNAFTGVKRGEKR